MSNISHSIKSILFFSLGIISLGIATPSMAATYCVDDFGDGPPNAADCPVDCVTSNGNCSLRDAVQAANANGNLDTIDIPAGTVTLSQVGDLNDNNASGDLDINRDVTLQGAGMSQTIVEWDSNLSDADKDRIFDVDPLDNAAKVVINDLTAQNGVIFDKVVDQEGGAGIRQSDVSTLELRRVKIKNNVVDATGSDSGGGVQSFGSLEIYQSTIEGNKSSGGGAGIFVGTASGDLVMEDSTVSGNETTEGGIGAGGIAFGQFTTWAITNSTISNNTALGADGGVGSDGTGKMTNVTVTENSSASGGGGIGQGGVGTFTIRNTIIAGNTAGTDATDCEIVSMNLVTEGSNLIGDGTGCDGVVNGVMNDQVGTSASPIDPLLGPLQNNGGMTETHTLLTVSPARDAVSGGNCPPPNEDQRGQPRPLGGSCDIGSVEVGSSDLKVTLAADPSGTLETAEPVFLDLEVENLGPNENFAVTLVVDLPTGVDIQFIDPAGDCSQSGSQVICIFASLVDGDIEFVTLGAVFNLPGSLTTTATVSGSAVDLDPSNNTATLDTIVIGLPGGGCGLQASPGKAQPVAGILAFALILLTFIMKVRRKVNS